jgi:hypothetical protein
MLKEKSIFLLVLLPILLSYLLIFPKQSAAQENQFSLPNNIQPFWIKRASYSTSEGLVLSRPKSPSAQDQSLFSSKNLLTTIPSAVGGLTIVAGSIFAALRVRGKTRTFKKYMEKISIAEQTFAQSQKEGKKPKASALKELKETFSNMQNEIDLATANKKIDEDQRTTLNHTLERKLSQLAA